MPETTQNATVEIPQPKQDHDGRDFATYVASLQRRADSGEFIRKHERLHAAIHEAIRLGVKPQKGDTAEKALKVLYANKAKVAKVVQVWLNENPVMTRAETGNFQQGYHFGVRYRWEVPNSQKAVAPRSNGSASTATQITALTEQVAALTKLLTEKDTS